MAARSMQTGASSSLLQLLASHTPFHSMAPHFPEEKERDPLDRGTTCLVINIQSARTLSPIPACIANGNISQFQSCPRWETLCEALPVSVAWISDVETVVEIIWLVPCAPSLLGYGRRVYGCQTDKPR